MKGKNLLGFDVGSSSIKASIIDGEKGTAVGSAVSPKTELPMTAHKPGWAEQHPHTWWEHVVSSARELTETYPEEMKQVHAVGISYQMHGLVVLDKTGAVLRPSIIWCDSRAVPYGNRAFDEIGSERCLSRLMNSPGNFTAAKLAWVKENEPEVYAKVHTMMLPGDYIAYRMTGEINTTPSGLSEGILWDAVENGPADFLLDYFGFSRSILPEIVPNFAVQGKVTKEAASELGIPEGAAVSYRAGDQPNNALSLGVLEPGEVAATAGTSGVVYGILDTPAYDGQSRVNGFVHVNHTSKKPRYGILLCVNGTGILNRWLKEHILAPGGGGLEYDEMNSLADSAEPGSEGLEILPFGNGAERTLANLDPGASIHHLNFNIHSFSHLLRAGQEGIVYALQYGLEIMRDMGISVGTVKAGYANMFLSPLFRRIFATVTGSPVELYSTDGSQGAARGAGIGAGLYKNPGEAFSGLTKQEIIEPEPALQNRYRELYGSWRETLEGVLKNSG